MRCWAGVVDEDAYARERLYARETIELSPAAVSGGTEEPAAGDPVLLVAAGETPVLFGLGRIRLAYATAVSVAYSHRIFDDPQPVDLALPVGLHPVPPDDFERVAAGVNADRRTDADRSEWFVSVVLPIEASTRAEAVREFWTYVDKLGPRELPAFVWPQGNELALQAFVLGAETSLDPEDDD
jgi:hypothetical protein